MSTLEFIQNANGEKMPRTLLTHYLSKQIASVKGTHCSHRNRKQLAYILTFQDLQPVIYVPRLNILTLPTKNADGLFV